MTRHALIISNPGEIGAENYCEGVKKDVVNYKDFLKSPQGGGWYEWEITCLEKPSFQSLKSQIDLLESTEYTLIVFCGHGYSYENETVLELQKNINIYAYELKRGAKKRSIILDCCRCKVESIDESIIHEFASSITKRTMNSIEARLYYNELISECSNGIVIIYACDFDETAGDDSRKGGIYSSSLLEVANSWANACSIRTSESIVAVHDKAASVTKVKSGDLQNPQIEKPRTEPYFPFAVSV